jgi:uncharacterized membrane protein
MTTLTIWRFATADGADRAASLLNNLAQDKLITLHDAATVSWPETSKKPRTRQLHNLAGAGALSGAFWGMLFGLIFFVPLLGAAVGAVVGTAGGLLSDVGVDDELVRKVRAQVVPGTSALFVLSSDAVLDKIRSTFVDQTPELLFSNLSTDQENTLREVFTAEPAR